MRREFDPLLLTGTLLDEIIPEVAGLLLHALDIEVVWAGRRELDMEIQ